MPIYIETTQGNLIPLTFDCDDITSTGMDMLGTYTRINLSPLEATDIAKKLNLPYISVAYATLLHELGHTMVSIPPYAPMFYTMLDVLKVETLAWHNGLKILNNFQWNIPIAHYQKVASYALYTYEHAYYKRVLNNTNSNKKEV